ncbi:MAG: protease pro-enzyme activation domain-containing protein, partial [Steroidobacteraceae bacterium]
MRSHFRSAASRSAALPAFSVLLSVTALIAASVLHSPPAWSQNQTPAFVGEARDLGPADPHETMTVTLHLRVQSGLDQVLQSLYDPVSPQYRQWLSSDRVAAALAAAPADVATVHRFLAAHHLRWAGSAPGRILAQGTVADVQTAFNVALHLFDVGGRIVRANTSNPSIAGPAGAVISSVGGLAEHRMRPHWAVATNGEGAPFARVPLSEAPHGLLYSAQCFRAPQRVTFTSADATATYFGNRYGQDIGNAAFGTLPPCGYQPSDVWTAYGLNAL